MATIRAAGLFLTVAGIAVAQNQDARKIVEGVYRQDTSRDAMWRGTLDVIDKKGTSRKKGFAFRRLGSFGNSKTIVRFTDPPEVKGVGLLSINQRGANERQWMFTPAIQRVRRIAPQERGRRFLGTDFTNEDMAERVLEDFEYKLLAEGEDIDGRKTWKIEARPVDADRSQYRFVYLWIAKDIPYTVLAEYYDESGKLARVLKAGQIEKLSGIWLARRVEMSTPSEGSRTMLVIEDVKFNQGLNEDMFTLQSLEKGNVF
jgi:hypothetical protein